LAPGRRFRAGFYEKAAVFWKKAAQNFYDSGPGALESAKPRALSHKSLFAFAGGQPFSSEKEVLACC
jgi:hypothetical protein